MIHPTLLVEVELPYYPLNIRPVFQLRAVVEDVLGRGAIVASEIGLA